MPEPSWGFSNRWLTACTLDRAQTGIENRDLLQRLADEMIEARPIWKPLHRQPVFAGCTYYSHDNGSVSDQLYETGICLPSGSNMTDDDIARVTDKLKALLG